MLETYGRTDRPGRHRGPARGQRLPRRRHRRRRLRAADERELLDLVPQARLDGRGHGLGRPVPRLRQDRRPAGGPDPVDDGAPGRRGPGRAGPGTTRRAGATTSPSIRSPASPTRRTRTCRWTWPSSSSRRSSPATTRRRAIPVAVYRWIAVNPDASSRSRSASS
ncbi:MAG: hypothetical protein M0C28_47960 [Candidatus Moduliflexus flocculans]|nr:hypothetical protein [Candidatus Moduliflexus flocculans]